MKERIIYEDNHLIAINKLGGELVQGDKTGDIPLLEDVKQYIKVTYNKPGNVFLGLTHRLDRPTSGVVLFAKTSKALSRVNRMFSERIVKKQYLTVVDNLPDPTKNRLEDYLVKHAPTNKSRVCNSKVPGAKQARLQYEWLGGSDNYHLLSIIPETGRHHQIRVQLSSRGWIIKGDLKYGAKRSNPDASIHLHAYALKLPHPVGGKELILKAPLPKETLWQHFDETVKVPPLV